MTARSLLMLALATGCSADRLEAEWAVSLDQMEGRPLVVIDSLPPRDAVGIGREMAPYLLFSRPLTPTESATLELATEAGEPVPTTPRRDIDDLAVAFDPGLLSEDLGYSGQVQLGGEPATAIDYRTTPPTGAPFNMSTGLEVTDFGGGGNLDLVNALFDPGVFPLWILQVQGLGSPPELLAPVELVIAPGRIDSESPIYVVHGEWGYVTVFRDVVVGEDGGFVAARPSLFLPLWSSDAVHLLRLTGVELTGALHVDGASVSLVGLTLTGVLGTRSLLALSRSSEGWRLAVDAARLDVDTNGNGRPDAVTFTFTVDPSPIPIEEIDL